MLLDLADDGLKDAATGIRGWNQKADVGSQPLGYGLFYLAVNSGGEGRQPPTSPWCAGRTTRRSPLTPSPRRRRPRSPLRAEPPHSRSLRVTLQG